MKKLFFCVCAILLVTQVWGTDESKMDNENIADISKVALLPDLLQPRLVENAIGQNFAGKNVYFMGGFRALSYKKTDSGIEKIINDGEIPAIKNGVTNRVTQANGPYSIIGYSQGGLRSLGYITQLKKKYPNDVKNIDAVITVAGIDQGLKMLEGGLGAFKKRASEKVNIVGNGLRAAVGIYDIFYILGTIIPRDQAANASTAAFTLITNILPPVFVPYFVSAWADPNSKNYQQLDDMIPEYDYISNNVVKTIKHSYRVKEGKELSCEWRYRKILGIKVWYLWIGYVDVYTFHTSNEVIPKFDPDVPVGFIVGLNSNTIGMAEEVVPGLRTQIKSAEEIFLWVEGIHIAKCVVLFGLFSGSVTYARDADRAKRFMADIDKELNNLKRQTENDGLAALESQYIPKTFTDPNTGKTRTNLKNPVLGGGTKGYAEMPNYNHKNIVEKEATFKKARAMIDEGTRARRNQGLPR
jgi:hypothetical protein